MSRLSPERTREPGCWWRSGVVRDALYGQAEVVTVGLLLLAADRALAGSHGLTLALLLLASLMRPELWLLQAAYSVLYVVTKPPAPSDC